MKKFISLLSLAILMIFCLTACGSMPADLRNSKVITASEYWQILESLDYNTEDYGTTKYENDDGTFRTSYSDGINLIEYLRCSDNTAARDVYSQFVDVFDNSCSNAKDFDFGSRACWKADLDGGLYCEIYLVDEAVVLGYEIDEGYGKDNIIYTLECLRKVG